MKIRIKNTGEVVNVGTEFVYVVLAKAGIVEHVHEAPPKPTPKIQWKLVTEPDGELIIAVLCATCGATAQVKNPTSKFQFRCQCGVPTPLPTEYFEQYLKKLPEQKRKLYEQRS